MLHDCMHIRDPILLRVLSLTSTFQQMRRESTSRVVSWLPMHDALTLPLNLPFPLPFSSPTSYGSVTFYPSLFTVKLGLRS